MHEQLFFMSEMTHEPSGIPHTDGDSLNFKPDASRPRRRAQRRHHSQEPSGNNCDVLGCLSKGEMVF